MTSDSSVQRISVSGHHEDATRFGVLGALSFSHFLNDMIQSMILAIYPLIKGEFTLSFAQIGLITLTYQVTASLLQPVIGLYTDRHPKPYSVAIGMMFTLVGILSLSVAPSFGMVLVAAALVGTGSATFHPESSRIARLASGGQHGLAQSVFQVGGNMGSAMGPLLAAWIVFPNGRGSVAWFSLASLTAIVVLCLVGRWYKAHRVAMQHRANAAPVRASLPRKVVSRSIVVLLLLVFSKYFYMASISSYYTFYLITHFGLPIQSAQIYLFVFLFAAALGTLLGGPLGDRIGRKYVIWGSILGVAPFSLALPHVGLAATVVLTVFIGLILSSAFSAIVVYAQELIPGRVGAVSGLFFGLAFGIGGVGAALLGKLADLTDITTVYQVCAYLPLLGLLTVFLPDLKRIAPDSHAAGASRAV